MRLFLLTALLSLAACDGAADESPAFGDAYTVLVTDETPAVEDDRMSVEVEYAGGCEDHDFVLRSRVDGDLAEVWFVHDGRGDTCEALVAVTIEAALPGTVTDAPTVVLLTPAGLDVPLTGPSR